MVQAAEAEPSQDEGPEEGDEATRRVDHVRLSATGVAESAMPIAGWQVHLAGDTWLVMNHCGWLGGWMVGWLLTIVVVCQHGGWLLAMVVGYEPLWLVALRLVGYPYGWDAQLKDPACGAARESS